MGLMERRRPSRDAAAPASSQTQLRDLREQLSMMRGIHEGRNQMPGRPPSTSDSSVGEDTGGGAGGGMPLSSGQECAICRSNVDMRVGLQPCGHTACRDCVSQLVELNQRCHICRGTIEGLLPVYI